MRVGERILVALSRSPTAGDLEEAADGWTVENALDGFSGRGQAPPSTRHIRALS